MELALTQKGVKKKKKKKKLKMEMNLCFCVRVCEQIKEAELFNFLP